MKLETLSRVSMVGLRFVDAALGTLVTDGLQTEAYPVKDVALPKAWQRRIASVQTPSGIHTFYNLPGLSEDAFGAGDKAFWDAYTASSPERPKKPFIFEVTDSLGRFYKSTFRLELPIQFRPDPTQPPQPEAIKLYSKPSRAIPPGQLAVYCELTQGGEPARWGSLRISRTGITATGVADKNGRVLVIVPYPDPTGAISSPPTTTWKWAVTLETALFPVPSLLEPKEEMLDLDRLPQVFTTLPSNARLVAGLTYLEQGGSLLKKLDI